MFEEVVSKLEQWDSHFNTRPLRSNMRTGIGEVLSRLALLTPRPNERINPDFDRVYFHHVRKTAGTSIVVAFYALSGRDPRMIERNLYRYSFTRMGGIRFVGPDAKLIQRGRYFFAFSHMPSYIARPPQEGTYAFTVLRDPLKRVISFYRYLRSADADDGFVFRAPSEEQSWAQGSFGEFLDAVPKDELLRQLFMFSPTGSVSETVQRLQRLQLVLHAEDFAAGVDLLRQQTGLDLHVGRERASSATLEIPQTDLDRAREMLEPEYEMLQRLKARG